MRKKRQVSKKEQEVLPVEKRPRGRPAHPTHYCDRCGEQLETACRKRDHQRRCRPWRERLPKRPNNCKFYNVDFFTLSQNFQKTYKNIRI
jgi:hypothetical protein